MYGKAHKGKTLKLISKPGELNTIFGKKHSEKIKKYKLVYHYEISQRQIKQT